MPFMQLAQLALSDNAIYAACTIGIVRQCQICSYQPGITSGFSQNSHTFGIVRQCHLCSLHNWHCLTMPNMLIPAWYYKWVFAEVAHIWHCQTMPFMQLAQLALSDNAKYAHTSLVLQAGFRRSRTYLALSDNAIYATCIIGIVRQCQLCSYQPGITSGFLQKSHTFGIVRQCHLCSLHNWH